jgi:hypothetical protein
MNELWVGKTRMNEGLGGAHLSLRCPVCVDDVDNG